MKLYICLTYYHSLVTLVKSFVNNERYDLLLANDIPDFEDLKNRLQKTKRFNSIIEYDAINIRKHMENKNKIVYFLTDKSAIAKRVETFCKVDFNNYSDIYLYHDFSEIGKYFLIKHIPYHLLEDALDYFKYFDKYYTSVRPDQYTKGSLRFFFKDKFGIGYRLWGMAPECIDIEVNDMENLRITNEKCFEISRKELFNKLSSEQKVVIFNTFASGKELNVTTGKTTIICTQPLFKDKFVKTEKEQLLVFKSVIKEYADKGYQIVIKPHPRDMIDYKSLVKEYNCSFIDKNLPSEILNFNPEAHYDVAVSITSTAINFLQYADEKRFMGREYIAEVLGDGEQSK